MLRLAFQVISLLSVACYAAAKPEGGGVCNGPGYKIARRYSGKGETASLAISVNAANVTVRKLLALVCELRTDYSQEGQLRVDIFNDYEAARWTNPHSVEDVPQKGNSIDAYVAYYYLDREKAKETLTLVVDPGHPCGNDIDIDVKNHTVSFASCK
jgi:hypothetical protein